MSFTIGNSSQYVIDLKIFDRPVFAHTTHSHASGKEGSDQENTGLSG